MSLTAGRRALGRVIVHVTVFAPVSTALVLVRVHAVSLVWSSEDLDSKAITFANWGRVNSCGALDSSGDSGDAQAANNAVPRQTLPLIIQR